MSTQRNQLIVKNVEQVVNLAREASARRSFTAKVGAWITGSIGTMASVIVHLLFIGGWCFYNTVGKAAAFDPYPFNLLTLIVSFESVLIALFVLLTQNRMSQEADLRAHLNLQVGILIEQELTAVLQLVNKIAEKQDIQLETETVKNLLETTNIEELANELESKLPKEQ
jgi:uncharacterized membrane protein